MPLSNLWFVLTIPKYDLVDPGVKFHYYAFFVWMKKSVYPDQLVSNEVS